MGAESIIARMIYELKVSRFFTALKLGEIIGKRAFTIQYHPEACPGPHDASPLFDRFANMVADHLAGIPLPTSGGEN